MFYIIPQTPQDWIEALHLISYYHVALETYMEDDDPATMYGAVVQDHYDEPSGECPDVRLAEMAFQINWHQGGECPECTQDEISVCVDCDIRYSCDDTRDECPLKHIPRTCGHLVFTKPIQRGGIEIG